MSKIILSGDLSTFRPEMLLRILESVRTDAVITLEGSGNGQICVLQGRVCGAVAPPNRGIDALREMVGWQSGVFTVRKVDANITGQLVRHPDIMAYPDNASLFRGMMRASRPGVGTGPVPAAQAGPATRGPKIGPLARVPQLTQKGKATAKTLQANAQRGVAADADKWRLLLKCNGEATLFKLGEELQMMGERLLKALKELQEEGLVTVEAPDAAAQAAPAGVFRFGDYLISKGYITPIQLEAALKRQQELARKGRFSWLGELLVEMNYVRAGQVKEALDYQKMIKATGKPTP